ncbi:MAG: hypothetical protein ACK5PS_10660, partial [Desulfopila sp.]
NVRLFTSLSILHTKEKWITLLRIVVSEAGAESAAARTYEKYHEIEGQTFATDQNGLASTACGQ